MQEIEKCRFCGNPTIPKGRQIFKGKKVDIVECKRCGISKMVATRDII